MHVIGQKPHEKSHLHKKNISNLTLSFADDETRIVSYPHLVIIHASDRRMNSKNVLCSEPLTALAFQISFPCIQQNKHKNIDSKWTEEKYQQA